jgi:hypothetical protein
MTMKKEGARRISINLALFLMALVMLVSTGPSTRTRAALKGATRASDSGDCMSQCHMNMSDCLGNGGGHQCMDDFYECSRGCDQMMQ